MAISRVHPILGNVIVPRSGGDGGAPSWRVNDELNNFISFLNAPLDVASPLTITGATPTLTFVDTDGEDFNLQVNGNTLSIINATGPITFVEFRGGSNDDILVLRPATFTAPVAGATPLIAKAAASPTADIIQAQNSSAQAKFKVTALGGVESRLSLSSTENTEMIKHGGVVRVDVQNVGNSSTSETTLFTATIKANTLNSTGDAIEFEAAIFSGNNGNTKTLRLKFGGNTFLTHTFQTNFEGRTIVRGHLKRANSTQCRTCVFALEGSSTSGTTQNTTTQLDFVSFTPGSDQVFSITGQGGATDDIIYTSCILKFWPANAGLT